MSARDGEPRDGREAVFLRRYRALRPRQQQALGDAMLRALDGQPMIESIVEAYIELGDSPAAARRRVREVLSGTARDWRKELN